MNEKPEVLHKHVEPAESAIPEADACTKPATTTNTTTPVPKPSMLIPVRDKTPLPQPPNQQNNNKSPIKKCCKSLLPLAKPQETKPEPPPSKSKDLVAEIDADSRMVNHCLQEAEMLEQQLSRKLQRQHQDGTSHYVQNSPARGRVDNHHRPASKAYGSRLQKASSTSQIKNLAGVASSRGRSPGRGMSFFFIIIFWCLCIF